MNVPEIVVLSRDGLDSPQPLHFIPRCLCRQLIICKYLRAYVMNGVIVNTFSHVSFLIHQKIQINRLAVPQNVLFFTTIHHIIPSW